VDFFIVFTDIEGSTRLWELYPSEMFRVIARHDDIIQSACDEHGGRIVKTMGDGFFIVFEDVRAVRAAVAMRNACEIETWDIGEQVKIKVGIHRSEVRERNSDFYGQGINLTARLVSAAWGSQILCTREVIEALEAQESQDAKLTGRYLGDGRLKHISDSVPLYQIEEAEDSRSFPELRALVPNPCNFGAPVMPIIGREDEKHQIKTLLTEEDVRLVTIHGIGGMGKTALAKTVGQELLAIFHGGVFFIPFNDSSAELLSTIMRSIDLPAIEEPEHLDQYFSSHRVLLILDNFELCLNLAPEVGKMLERYPKMQCLCTSRIVLNHTSEHRILLGSLPVPRSDSADSEIVSSPSVMLFERRIRQINPVISVSEENRRQIAQMCTLVEGIPLAIEIIASKLRDNSIDQIAELVKSMFSHASRYIDWADRHSSMGNAISWSLEDLDSSLKRSILRLWLLPEAFSLNYASNILSINLDQCRDLLSELADRSLIQIIQKQPRTIRYSMHWVLREYIRTSLSDREIEELYESSTAFYLDYLIQRQDPDQFCLSEALKRDLHWEIVNIEFCLHWLIAKKRKMAVQYVQILGSFWVIQSLYQKGLDFIEECLGYAPEDGHLQYRRVHLLCKSEKTEQLLAIIASPPAIEEPWNERMHAEFQSFQLRRDHGLLEQSEKCVQAYQDSYARLRLRCYPAPQLTRVGNGTDPPPRQAN
jgi:class 3 adenylate cyclase/predicted ATPase